MANNDYIVFGRPNFTEEEIEAVAATLRSGWAGTWSKKAAREFSSRVDLWRKALNDLLDEPGGLKNAYPSRVRVRVMLELLITEMAPERPAEIDLLAALDGRLRGATRPGPFIWDACFTPGFPPDQYWFLYVQFGQ